MKLSEIEKILQATVLAGANHLDKTVVGGGAADLMNDVLAAVIEDAVLLTGLTTEEVIQTAVIAGAGAVVFVRGKKPEESVLELARERQLPLMMTRYSLFVACGRLYINGLRGLDGSW
jgi:predicted transcriptional regulator